MTRRLLSALALCATLALVPTIAAADSGPMHIVRFHHLPTGESRFQDVAVSLPDQTTDAEGNSYQLSRAIDAGVARFVVLPSGFAQGWHNAPARQFVVVMSGALEVETTDGEKRQWRAGAVFLADDVEGRGHKTRVLEGPAQLLFVRVPEDFDVAAWSGVGGE